MAPRLNTPGQLDADLNQFLTRQQPLQSRDLNVDFSREYTRRQSLDQVDFDYELGAEFQQDIQNRGLLPDLPASGLPDRVPNKKNYLSPEALLDLVFQVIMKTGDVVGTSSGQALVDAFGGSAGSASTYDENGNMVSSPKPL